MFARLNQENGLASPQHEVLKFSKLRTILCHNFVTLSKWIFNNQMKANSHLTLNEKDHTFLIF